MFCKKQVQAVDIAMEPLEFVTPEPKSREDIAEESESDDHERIDDNDGAGEATLQEAELPGRDGQSLGQHDSLKKSEQQLRIMRPDSLCPKSVTMRP